MSKTPGLFTRALHGGSQPDSATGARAVPIYQSTSFVFRDTEHAANLFNLSELGYIYTRLGNPTCDALEKRLAALHGAPAVVSTASGMAAIFYAVTAFTSAGQNIVSGANLYGGTHTLFQHTLSRFGIEVRFVDTADPENVRAAIDEKTRLVFTETIGNPRCNVDDLRAISQIAKDAQIPFVLDNTVAAPPICDPSTFGADVVVYSLTKVIGGHGSSIGGCVVDMGSFDWTAKLPDGTPKYPEMTEPDPAYHGLTFHEVICRVEEDSCAALSAKIRTGLLRDVGASLSPFNAFLFVQGLETLPLRAPRHCENARTVAEFLNGHPNVAWVNYAGLPEHKDHARAKEYFPHGPGAVFGFGLKGGREAGKRFIESVELCSHLANILDARTLVIHPATTTHSQLSEDELAKAGVSPDMVRISVGLEDAADIIADLDQALAKAHA